MGLTEQYVVHTTCNTSISCHDHARCSRSGIRATCSLARSRLLFLSLLHTRSSRRPSSHTASSRHTQHIQRSHYPSGPSGVVLPTGRSHPSSLGTVAYGEERDNRRELDHHVARSEVCITIAPLGHSPPMLTLSLCCHCIRASISTCSQTACNQQEQGRHLQAHCC